MTHRLPYTILINFVTHEADATVFLWLHVVNLHCNAAIYKVIRLQRKLFSEGRS